jgi:PAS domain S-box-containing protein
VFELVTLFHSLKDRDDYEYCSKNGRYGVKNHIYNLDRLCYSIGVEKPKWGMNMLNLDRNELELIFEYMIDKILFFSIEGNVLYANGAARLFLGYDKEEIEQLQVNELDQEVSTEYMHTRLLDIQEKNMELDTVFTKKDSSKVPVKIQTVSVNIEHNLNKIIICVVHDMLNLLNENDRNDILKTSLEFVDEAFLIFEPDMKISGWNKKAEELFGFGREELLGNRVTGLLPENKKSELTWIVERLNRGETITNHLTTRYNKEKREIQVLISCAAFYDQNSELSAYLVKYIQKKSLLALEGGDFGIWDYNFKDNSVEVYNHLVQDGRLVVHDVQSSLQYLVEEDVNYLLDDIHKLSAQNDAIDLELQIKPEYSQNIKWLRLKGKVFEFDESKKPIRLVGTFEDITAIKKMVEELIYKNKELDCMVDNAKKAERAKSMFLANMSHEIRTPLNGIIVATDTIKKAYLSESQKSLFSIIESSAVTLNGIVTDILDFSKIDQGKLSLNYAWMDFAEMMQTVLVEIQTSANQKGLETGFYFDQKVLRKYYADHRKIKQVLNNMISNALKFTEKGSINLRVAIKEETEEYSDVLFTVTDTGIGIKEELQKRIFEVFYQVDESSTKFYSGTGLGLTISKSYAEAMEGSLTFTSQENIGSEFYFQCRLYKWSDNAMEDEQSGVNLKDTLDMTVKEDVALKLKRKILSVDDNMINQELIKRILEESGYEVALAYSAEDMMQTLNGFEPDLILMDIQLPGKSGYEITTEIRDMDAYKEIPIIAMTAYTRKEDEDKCRRAGMNDYIPKPIKINILKQKIDHFIG